MLQVAHKITLSFFTGASQVALVVKNCLLMQEMQETWIQSLGQKDPLKYPTPVFLPGESHG